VTRRGIASSGGGRQHIRDTTNHVYAIMQLRQRNQCKRESQPRHIRRLSSIPPGGACGVAMQSRHRQHRNRGGDNISRWQKAAAAQNDIGACGGGYGAAMTLSSLRGISSSAWLQHISRLASWHSWREKAETQAISGENQHLGAEASISIWRNASKAGHITAAASA